MKLAEEKWLSISEVVRTKILENVWCSQCKGAVTIIDFVVNNDRMGVLLEGKCKVCTHDVVRIVEVD